MARRNLSKGRSHKTSQRKLSRLKTAYRLLFQNSVKNKKSNINKGYKSKKSYFCDKYPNIESFLKTIIIKPSNKTK